jgi:hypothetical protein
MSAVWVATARVEPLDVLFDAQPRTVLPRVRHGLEYVPDPRKMSRLHPPVAMDIVSPLSSVVAARGLVRRT